ncbi:MAG: type II toxin-antitoxin system VapC family toxin [Thermoplasmata archaeon]|nr:type II toxin-antitoxin system VapC family toxin [Thermoplasmata archaeon]
MRIYLDNCCYGRPYDSKSQIRIQLESDAKLAIQHRIEAGKYDLVASSFLLDENNKKTDVSVRSHIFDYIDSNMKVFVQEDEDPELRKLASEIEETGIKSLDASHLAAAIYAECNYFITTDDRILKYKTDKIKIVNPVQFITEEE